MLPLPLPSPGSTERRRLLSAHLMRRRALERLYERRDAVDALIRSLERYKATMQDEDPTPCVEFSAVGK